MKKQLVKIFFQCSKDVKLNVTFKWSNKLKNSFKCKDRLPSHLNSNLYQFKWDSCNAAYIGKTKRHVRVRQYEHLGKSILTEKPLEYNENDATAIWKHSHNENHLCERSNFKIIGSASDGFFLKLKESFLIMNFKPLLNIAKESLPIYIFQNDSL